MHSKILKHLGIIEYAVALQDKDLVAMQVQILQILPLDAKVKQILALISTQRFQYVIQLIEQYKRESNGVTMSEDPQIQGLKLELKVLKERANELTDIQADIERYCYVFQNEYRSRLGSLLEEILKLQAETSLDAEEQQQAEQAYESFQCTHQQELDELVYLLSSDEQHQLKTAYQLASRLCHPDNLADEFKNQGLEIFNVLNEAYYRQNLQRVLKVLQSLEAGKPLGSASDGINDKAILQAKTTALRTRIFELEAEITALQNSEVYQRIQTIENREVYFNELKEALYQELAHVKHNNIAYYGA